MQSVSSRIWTRVAVFISYDDNDYTTGTSNKYWYAIKTNQRVCFLSLKHTLRIFYRYPLKSWNAFCEEVCIVSYDGNIFEKHSIWLYVRKK